VYLSHLNKDYLLLTYNAGYKSRKIIENDIIL